MESSSPLVGDPSVGGRGDLYSTDIVGMGEGQSWTSSSEDIDTEQSKPPSSDGEYGACNSAEADMVPSGTGVCSREEKCGFHDGGDVDVEASKAEWRVHARRHIVLQRIRKQLQFPPKRPFDKEDITWMRNTNSNGRLKKEVLHAIILWNRLEDFVEGESICQDFPCAFHQKKQKSVQSGARSRVSASTFM
jgi:hypothetical protein